MVKKVINEDAVKNGKNGTLTQVERREGAKDAIADCK